MGGKGSGGRRDYTPCAGTGLALAPDDYLEGLSGVLHCPECGKQLVSYRYGMVPRHKELSRVVQEWNEMGA